MEQAWENGNAKMKLRYYLEYQGQNDNIRMGLEEFYFECVGRFQQAYDTPYSCAVVNTVMNLVPLNTTIY